MKRRQFLLSGIGAAATASYVSAAQPQFRMRSETQSQGRKAVKVGPKHPVRLGAPIFFSDADIEQWALEARKNYRAVYAPNVSINDKDRIKAVVDATTKNDLVIAEVGRWCNMLDADPEKRKANLDAVAEGLALADEIGARCCVNIAGSFNPTAWDGPDPKNLGDEFFEITVENARKVIDAAKPKRAKFALEMMGWALPDSVESYLQLIKAINRDGFGVHVDICNMINSPKKFWNTTDLINETFDKLDPWIASCHIKDLKWIHGSAVHFAECPLGEGKIDFATYLKRLSTHPDKDVPVMIEHMSSEEEYIRCRDHLKTVAAENSVLFEYV
ncbi:MAG: sugar phosphate isomerase/epimerase family protein [Thermoguttaceae bacterium]